jgi:2-amino-4-hydroxy-6-hydroxymethyldihydropteridine diphosphokinase
MNSVIFSLGSNQGNKSNYLEKALEEIDLRIGKISKKSFVYETEPVGFVSFVYETEPVGFESNDSFLNACIEVKTILNPNEILAITQQIEIENGRSVKTLSGYTSRTLDIDIIFFNSLVLESETIQIPHPRYSERLFVLIPLCDIAPEWKDPTNTLTIKQLKDVCSDTSEMPKKIKPL